MSLSQHGKQVWASQDWRVYGTGARLAVTDAGKLEDARAVINQELSAIDLAASRFRDDSELSRLNEAGGRPTQVSPLFAELLTVALEAASDTEGVVDPTLGVALREVGYDRTFREIDREGPPIRVTLRRQAEWQMIEFDVDSGTVRLPEWVELDLGATAKAHAADRAAAAAHTATGAGVLLSLGGDIAVAGPPPADGWPVRITDDSNDPVDAPGPIVVITSGGLATSSTTARRWLRGGEVVHHLLEPWTGLPAMGPYRTASVVADSCVRANVAATAAIVLGADAPRWLLAREVPARLVAYDGAVRVLSGWPEDPR